MCLLLALHLFMNQLNQLYIVTFLHLLIYHNQSYREKKYTQGKKAMPILEYIQIALVMNTLSTSLKIWNFFKKDNQLTHQYNESLSSLLLAYYGFYMTNTILWRDFWVLRLDIIVVCVFIEWQVFFFLTVEEIMLYFIKEKNEFQIIV